MKSRYLLLSFSVICLFYACTDVPLSYNTQILSPRILGYWQANDSTAFSFTEKDARAIFQAYKYDPRTDQYVKDGDPSGVYFSDILIAGKNHQFISIGETKDSSFLNLEYSFKPEGYLELKGIQTRSSGRDYFKTAQNFRQYVKEKITTADFYGNTILVKRQ